MQRREERVVPLLASAHGFQVLRVPDAGREHGVQPAVLHEQVSAGWISNGQTGGETDGGCHRQMARPDDAGHPQAGGREHGGAEGEDQVEGDCDGVAAGTG